MRVCTSLAHFLEFLRFFLFSLFMASYQQTVLYKSDEVISFLRFVEESAFPESYSFWLNKTLV